jgi:RNA polymerase sigma-70 factor (ECF subfamily)
MAFLFALTADAAEAQDLVQETFLKAWQAAPRWEPRAKASTWLFQIARRTAWNALAKRRPVPLADLPPSRGTHPDAAGAARPTTQPDAVRDDALAARLSAAIAELTPPLRLVFVLVRVCGLPLAETALVADVPVGTVKSRLAAAEARLRARLADLAPGAERGPDPRR